MNLDFEQLRQDLIEYFGTSMFNASPLAIVELTKVQNATSEELIKIAKNNNFDISKYQINTFKF